MAYIQITTRCNMSCEHCCMDATEKGQDMTLKVFKAACALAECHGESISLGGGEPTLHKKFWEFFGIALSYTAGNDTGVWLATNGSQTSTAIRLASLARAGVIGVALSQDSYHDYIDDAVISAFTQGKLPRNGYGADNDLREIRNVDGKEVAVGRAKDWAESQDCNCAEIFIDPAGGIWACGCKKVSFGTVFKPEIPEDLDEVLGDSRCSEK